MDSSLNKISLVNSTTDRGNIGQEFSASEVRKLLQILFPQRRLVLSQFTFFNQVGVSNPSGSTSRRGRRCYRLEDLLPIALVLALKEEGIPYKNLEKLPKAIQENLEKIFSFQEMCIASGWGTKVNLCFGPQANQSESLLSFLDEPNLLGLYWSFDVSDLAKQLIMACEKYHQQKLQSYSSIYRAA